MTAGVTVGVSVVETPLLVSSQSFRSATMLRCIKSSVLSIPRMACVCASVLLTDLVQQQYHHGQAIKTPCQAALQSQVLSDYRAAFVLNMAARTYVFTTALNLSIHHRSRSRLP